MVLDHPVFFFFIKYVETMKQYRLLSVRYNYDIKHSYLCFRF